MKRAVFLCLVFISIGGLVKARTLPPVVVSGDLESRKKNEESDNKASRACALYVAPYDEFGSVAAGGQPPPSVDTVARLVQAALPDDRYRLIASETETLDEVIGVQWGEVSPEGPAPFIQAREGGVVKPIWAVVVGRTHVPPFFTSTQLSDLQNELSRDRFFLIISAYDAAALRQGKVSIRWQTRTSVDSLHVRAGEAWEYLAGVAQANLAKRIERPVFVSDAPRLVPSSDAIRIVPVNEIIPGATKLLTFEKATPPY